MKLSRLLKENRPIVIFHHIPKTSGTSFRNWLYENIGSDNVYWHVPEELLATHTKPDNLSVDHKRFGAEHFNQFSLMGGHFNYAQSRPEMFNRPVIRAGIVREPCDQLISHYQYIFTRPENILYAPTIDEALSEEHPFAQLQKNCHIRYLTGRDTAAAALDKINDELFIVGCYDHLDKFINAIAKLLNLPADKYPHSNIGSNKQITTSRIDPKKWCEEHCQEDIKFFKKIKKSKIIVTGSGDSILNSGSATCRQ